MTEKFHEVPCKPLKDLETEVKDTKDDIQTIKENVIRQNAKFDMYIELTEGRKILDKIKRYENPGDFARLLRELKKKKNLGLFIRVMIGLGAVIGGFIIATTGGVI